VGETTYVSRGQALLYGRFLHPIPATRGWTGAIVEENHPGWTLGELLGPLREQGVIGPARSPGLDWLRRDVVGAVVGDGGVELDTGALQHPAKGRRLNRTICGSVVWRGLWGDDDTDLVLLVRCAPHGDGLRLHRLARTLRQRAVRRPTLLLNTASTLAPASTVSAADLYGRLIPALETPVRYGLAQDLARVAQRSRRAGGAPRLVELACHTDGPELLVARWDTEADGVPGENGAQWPVPALDGAAGWHPAVELLPASGAAAAPDGVAMFALAAQLSVRADRLGDAAAWLQDVAADPTARAL
jgi:hypothetical protein